MARLNSAILGLLGFGLGLVGACGTADQGVDGAVHADGDGVADAAPAADGAPRDGATGVDGCGFADKFKPSDEVLFFHDPKLKTEVQIVRRGIGRGGGFTAIYQLMAFGLLREGQLHCISEAKALSYDYSHHNWMDFARATEGSVRYELNISFQPEDPNEPVSSPWVWTYPLRAFDLAGNLLWGPELLEKVPPN
jgi:hypothetical protein